jgi:hypothetical protein
MAHGLGPAYISGETISARPGVRPEDKIWAEARFSPLAFSIGFHNEGTNPLAAGEQLDTYVMVSGLAQDDPGRTYVRTPWFGGIRVRGQKLGS